MAGTKALGIRREVENLDFCLPERISFRFCGTENVVVIDETTTGVVCCDVLVGVLLPVDVAITGPVVLDNSSCFLIFASFSFRIASCRFLNL